MQASAEWGAGRLGRSDGSGCGTPGGGDRSPADTCCALGRLDPHLLPLPPPPLIPLPAAAVNGTPSCASEPLLTGLLRGQLGFGGFVVTDNRGEGGHKRHAPAQYVQRRLCPEEKGERGMLGCC